MDKIKANIIEWMNKYDYYAITKTKYEPSNDEIKIKYYFCINKIPNFKIVAHRRNKQSYYIGNNIIYERAINVYLSVEGDFDL